VRILVLGGTQFIGRQIVLEFMRAGDAVTILNRGKTPDDLPAEVERLRGDRSGGLVST
jgi:2'-hydroxyisoflavone reductase